MAVNSSQQEVWSGNDGRLWEAFYSDGNGQWYGPNDLGFGPLNSSPQPQVRRVAAPSGFSGTTKEMLLEAWYAGASQTTDIGMGPIASGPSVALDPQTGWQWISFEGQGGGGLFESHYNGAWQTNYVGMGSSPSPPSTTAPGGKIDIFAQGYDGNLYEARRAPTWQGPYNWGFSPV